MLVGMRPAAHGYVAGLGSLAMQHASEFSESAVFRDIDPKAVAELCKLGRVLTFEAGHELFSRAQNADELMVLKEGVVELLFPVEIMGVTRELTLQRPQAGDVVAWSALVSPYRFTLSARCASRCVLTGFNREALHAFFETDPHTGYRFMRNLAGVIGRRLQTLQTIWMHDLQASAVKGLGS